MSIISRSLLETEVKLLTAQILKIQPGALNTSAYSDEILKPMADEELTALIDEMKDLLRTLGGVRKR